MERLAPGRAFSGYGTRSSRKPGSARTRPSHATTAGTDPARSPHRPRRGVAEDGNIGDRAALADEERAIGQMLLEDRESALADGKPGGGERWVAAGHRPEPRRADPAHHPLLLEGEPLRHEPALEARVGQIRRRLGQVPEDRVRLGDHLARVELQHRRLANRVQRPVLVGQRVAGEDVDRNPLVRRPEQRRAGAEPCSSWPKRRNRRAASCSL